METWRLFTVGFFDSNVLKQLTHMLCGLVHLLFFLSWEYAAVCSPLLLLCIGCFCFFEEDQVLPMNVSTETSDIDTLALSVLLAVFLEGR